MGRFRPWISPIVTLAALLAVLPGPVRADEEAAAPPPSPGIVLARLAGDPHVPDGYSAAVELHAKMRSFPFIGVTVHGISTYRRPGLYHYQLQNLPRIAAKFDDLRYDLGDPAAWNVRYEIAMAPGSTDDAPALRLTPRKPGLVLYLDIVTDAKRGRLLHAVWKRRDGGTISLTQTYASIGAADVVTEQHATIDIPHMRAELTATYSNISVDTSTFAGIGER